PSHHRPDLSSRRLPAKPDSRTPACPPEASVWSEPQLTETDRVTDANVSSEIGSRSTKENCARIPSCGLQVFNIIGPSVAQPVSSPLSIPRSKADWNKSSPAGSSKSHANRGKATEHESGPKDTICSGYCRFVPAARASR